jgi:hypothetical protein
MSPALTQALQRLLVIAVVGALTAVGLNLTVLNGALPNAALLIPIITAIIEAVLKYLGGATIPIGNGYASASANKSLFDWPHFWSV